MDRDHELRIKGHLYEITELNDEILESRRGFPMSEEGYRKTLESVADCAGTDMVDKVAKHIKDHIRTQEERPKNNAVRKKARLLLVEEDIVPDRYLNVA